MRRASGRADAGGKDGDAPAKMGKQPRPIGPRLGAPFRRAHTAEDHIHQHAGPACRVVERQPAFRPAIVQPVGKVLAAGKHAFMLQDVDKLGKLSRLAKDELQETGTIRVLLLIHVDHEDTFEALGNREIFHGPGQIEHHTPMRTDDGGKQLFLALKQFVERLFRDTRLSGDDRGRASGIAAFYKNTASDLDDMRPLVLIAGDFRPAPLARLICGFVDTIHDDLDRLTEAHADDPEKRTAISEG